MTFDSVQAEQRAAGWAARGCVETQSAKRASEMIHVLGQTISWQELLLFAAVVATCVVASIVIRRSRQRRGLPVRFELWEPSSAAGTRGRLLEGALALALGALIMGGGTYVYGLPVTCDDKVMQPGDYCQTYHAAGGEAVGEPESYRERADFNHSLGIVIGIFGVFIAAQGAWWVSRSVRSRRHLVGQR
jgi:hypothetical protein